MNEPQSTPTPIPMPEHFPVVWDDPSDAQRFWEQDRMHFPAPIPPVMALFFEAHNAGFKHAFAHYEIPLVGLDLRRYNTYAYNSVIPRRLPPDELEAMGRRAEKNLGAAMGGMAERWSREFLPEIESHLEYWRTYDLQGADLDALLAHFAESRRRYTRLWEIHFEVMVPTLLAGSLFEEIYSELFGAERALDAYTCLQGFGNKTIEINIELWRLAQSADEEVRRVILAEAPQAVAAVLSRSEAGRRFLVAFDAYRVAYGERGETWAFSVPTWMEDPTPIWRNLQEHLRHPEHNPEAEQARLAAAREKALAEARAQIAGYPKQVIEQFEYLLKAAQDAVVLSEDHGFYIDFCGSYQIRRLLLEFGRRFVAAGVLADGDDIMLLTPDEIVETARRLPHTDRKELVQERRREMQHFAALPAPPVLGTLPPGPPPDNPMARAIGRFFGTPPQETGATDLLQGHAGSPGVVSGIARVVPTLDEAQRVKPGEILVAPTTAPPWTPLFGSIAAIVTDTGGVLSHSAVVAREYGIPAVVGALRATRVIRDGQRIEVDGRAGTVRVLASEAATA